MGKLTITGAGLLFGECDSMESYWEYLCNGDKRIFSKLAYDIKKYIGSKGLRLLDNNTKMALVALDSAFKDSCLDMEQLDKVASGIALGDSFGSIESITGFDLHSLKNGFQSLNPMNFVNTVMNAPAGQLAIRYGIKGINVTLSTGYTASLDALAYCMDTMDEHDIDLMAVGGVEEFCDIYQNYMKMQGESIDNLSDGSGFITIEKEKVAEERKASRYADLLGYGREYVGQCDAEKYSDVMKKALEESGIDESEVTLVIDSSVDNNSQKSIYEKQAIHKMFTNDDLCIYSPKDVIGENYSAAGIFQIITALIIIQHAELPNGKKIRKHGKALVNLFSNVGNCVSIILKY